MSRIKTSKKFLASQKKALKKYALSEKHVQETIDSLENDPYQGDAWPGFSGHSVRKMRIGLPEYNVSPRQGLRFIYYHSENKDVVFPIILKQKGTYNERDLKREVAKILKDFLAE